MIDIFTINFFRKCQILGVMYRMKFRYVVEEIVIITPKIAMPAISAEDYLYRETTSGVRSPSSVVIYDWFNYSLLSVRCLGGMRECQQRLEFPVLIPNSLLLA